VTLKADAKKRVTIPGPAPGGRVYSREGRQHYHFATNLSSGAEEKAHEGTGPQSCPKFESIAWREMGRPSGHDSGAMTLLDTNVVIDAQNRDSSFYRWSNDVIVEALAGDGAGVNAIIVAELCATERARSEHVEEKLRSSGMHILDLPAREGNR
jgi:hypothetical protein